jgi:hypothetical protein
VIRYGQACLGIARDYIRTHMDELVALARPDGLIAAAAE